jgi:hypothetical protein
LPLPTASSSHGRNTLFRLLAWLLFEPSPFVLQVLCGAITAQQA